MGITTLDRYISHEIGALKPGIATRLAVCPACVPNLRVARKAHYYNRAELPLLAKERYGKDYVVRCCPRCGRCFYYDRGNKLFVELAFRYGDFFKEEG